MNYTILVTEEIQGNLSIDFGKDGNLYSVHIYNKESKQHTSKKFASIDTAFMVYSKLCEFLAKGLYSEQDKRRFLIDYNA